MRFYVQYHVYHCKKIWGRGGLMPMILYILNPFFNALLIRFSITNINLLSEMTTWQFLLLNTHSTFVCYSFRFPFPVLVTLSGHEWRKNRSNFQPFMINNDSSIWMENPEWNKKSQAIKKQQLVKRKGRKQMMKCRNKTSWISTQNIPMLP